MTDASRSRALLTGSLAVNDPQMMEILDQYLARLEAGETPNVDELIAQCPELADELRAYFDSIDFLRQAAVEPDSSLLEDWAGRSLGDYDILREIGRGGMGIVYEAKQTSLDRRVALKVLPFASVLDRRQITRFTIEAQAAAQLHHPHIVPVYGVGCEQGIHFYSMQFIEGRSLDAVIDELRELNGESVRTTRWSQKDDNPPRTRQDLARETACGFSTVRSAHDRGYIRSVARLGIAASEALHHAHDYGIVHRDVKPSNLLLDSDGKLWVTDFGLARFPTEVSLTMTGAVLGTVRYMSPEQAAGDSSLVDQRSDIYSLGATLYELLTLQSVFDADNREQFLTQIAHVEPQPPRRINSAIPVDLETIILKALSKSRQDRYPTAQAMADDLQRFLDDSPIAARRPSLVDRASKWATRHKALVRTSVAMLLLMFTGACLSVLLIAREQQQTKAALRLYEDNFEELRDELGSFGVLVADQLAELPGAEPMRNQILNRTLAVYDRLIDQARGDPSLRADLGIALFKAGELRERLGQTAAALESFERAATAFGPLQKDEPANHKLRHDVAACHNNIARLQANDGDTQAAQTAFQEAIRLQRIVAATTDDSEEQLALASMLHNFGVLLRQIGELGQAGSSHAEALAIQKRLSERAPQDQHLRRELAMSYNNLSFLRRDDDLAEAIDLNDQALKILRDCSAAPADLALSLNNRGALLSRSGDLDAAHQAYEEAVAAYARLAKQAPSIVNHRRDLAVSQNNLGRVLSELQRTADAERAFAAARDALAALAEEAPDELSYRSSLGGVLNNQAMLLERNGRTDEATAAYEQAIEHHRFVLVQAPAVQHFQAFLERTCENYARMLRDAGDQARATDIERAKKTWLVAARDAKQRE